MWTFSLCFISTFVLQVHVNDLGECLGADVGDASANVSYKKNIEAEIVVKSDEDNQDVPGEVLLKDISDIAKKCVTVIEVAEVYRCNYCDM